MPIHFAAARSGARSPVARALTRKAVGKPANDNPRLVGDLHDPVLTAALHHFGAYGLRAADQAAKQARAAALSGDRHGCRWWTRICATLDRRMGRDLIREMNGTIATAAVY